MTKCISETVEIPNPMEPGPYEWEVRCSVHGRVFGYTVIQIRVLGADELQRQIDRAWVTHAASEEN